MAKTMQPAALLIDVNDLHALGLEETKGLLWVTAFYWDQDPARQPQDREPLFTARAA